MSSRPLATTGEHDDEQRTRTTAAQSAPEASMLGEHLRPTPATALRDPRAVEELVRAGDFVGAMAAYREQTATSKLEARLAVERIRQRMDR